MTFNINEVDLAKAMRDMGFNISTNEDNKVVFTSEVEADYTWKAIERIMNIPISQYPNAHACVDEDLHDYENLKVISSIIPCGDLNNIGYISKYIKVGDAYGIEYNNDIVQVLSGTNKVLLAFQSFADVSDFLSNYDNCDRCRIIPIIIKSSNDIIPIYSKIKFAYKSYDELKSKASEVHDDIMPCYSYNIMKMVFGSNEASCIVLNCKYISYGKLIDIHLDEYKDKYFIRISSGYVSSITINGRNIAAEDILLAFNSKWMAQTYRRTLDLKDMHVQEYSFKELSGACNGDYRNLMIKLFDRTDMVYVCKL